MHKRELNIIVNKEDNAIKRGDFFEEIVSKKMIFYSIIEISQVNSSNYTTLLIPIV